jgi:2-phospho-L-lactate guanylyltransferase
LARGLATTFVVTADDHVAAIAAAAEAQVIREAAEDGETSAVDFARIELKQRGFEAVLILPGDMPLVRACDIEQMLAQVPSGAGAPFALLAPSHDRMGTNALLLAPPDVIELRFGFDSFTFHSAQVAARGLPLRRFENAQLALDIDEPQDLERFLAYELHDGESTQIARQLLAQAATEPRRGAVAL